MVGEIINNRVPNAFNLEAKSNETHCPKLALSRNTYSQHHLVLYHSTIYVQVRFSIDFATASFLGIQCDVQAKYWNNNFCFVVLSSMLSTSQAMHIYKFLSKNALPFSYLYPKLSPLN